MLWLLHYQDETTAKYLPFRSCVWCKPVLNRNFDWNADTLQQTIPDVGEQDPALQATGRTATNSHGQPMPNPPFGMPSFLLEPSQSSSKATSGLRLFYYYLCTATVQQRPQQLC